MKPSPRGPGVRNLISDIPGLKVGQAHGVPIHSGVTVILPDEHAACAADGDVVFAISTARRPARLDATYWRDLPAG